MIIKEIKDKDFEEKFCRSHERSKKLSQEEMLKERKRKGAERLKAAILETDLRDTDISRPSLEMNGWDMWITTYNCYGVSGMYKTHRDVLVDLYFKYEKPDEYVYVPEVKVNPKEQQKLIKGICEFLFKERTDQDALCLYNFYYGRMEELSKEYKKLTGNKLDEVYNKLLESSNMHNKTEDILQKAWLDSVTFEAFLEKATLDLLEIDVEFELEYYENLWDKYCSEQRL